MEDNVNERKNKNYFERLFDHKFILSDYSSLILLFINKGLKRELKQTIIGNNFQKD